MRTKFHIGMRTTSALVRSRRAYDKPQEIPQEFLSSPKAAAQL